VAELRRYSKDKLPVKKISSLMKRTVGALRQKARTLGIRLGHRRCTGDGLFATTLAG
jgi:hypothetical protein